MKNMIISVMLMIFLFWGSFTQAITVYFKDGTQLEVDQVTRIGNSVCLMVDLARIDTTRTPIETLAETMSAPPGKLSILNAEFLPSDDNRDIIAAGDVVNNTSATVRNIRVTVTLKDKNDNVLLTIHGYARPQKLKPGERGSYRIQVKKPDGFWKASVDLKAETVPQP